ncbi:MAG TPA: helicase C-terminal domain-containing protein, partial [Mariprofundaceae bacterium]|nr:helicase C-terminal domain-containing protein [Mariprofundaceae bacterium]
TGQFSNSFGELPDHPKYGQIVDLCVPDDLFSTPRNLHEDKHLVFVRRIPSVRELTQRINYAYDASLAGRIYGAWGLEADDPAVKKWRATSWSRKGFIELVLSRQSGEDEEDEIEGEELSGSNEDGDAYLGSTIGDLFVVKKERNNRTDCSNVSLRFRKAESAFAMFLEPSSDYLMEGYDVFEEYERGGKVRADYVNAAQEVRLRRHELFTQKAESVQRERQTKNYEKKVSTVWSMVYPELSVQQQDKIRDWSTNRPDVAENFSNYIKTGFLFASPVMVELYAWFTEFNLGPKVVDVQEKYSQFMKFVAPRIRDSLLLCYFKSALDTFEILCEKIIDHKLGEWEKDWRVLTSLQNPAWYASGQTTNRQRLILGFNSPFYPNVLVATSVFQEGVNLHLQCTKVHHYGIAGSPGDNEQRVGRVDRLFGKVNELLKVDGLAELEINYPFLKNSFDEDQVASFIARKFHIEEKMDACTQSSFDKVVELTQGDWEQFLRKPGKAIVVKDPYGAKFDKLPLGITYRPFESHASANVANHIASLFEEGLDPSIERLFVVGKNQHNPNAMLMIDPVVEHNNGQRRQPVLVEQHFSAEFSALVSGTVYYVSLTSPLASKEFLGTIDSDLCNKLASIGQEGSERYPLVRMAIDPNLAVSHFYLHVRVDLPLFVRAGSLVMLSREELMAAFNQLKDFSDRAEYELFSGERDLALDELRLAQFLTEREPLLSNTKPNHLMTTHSDRWEMVQCSVGLIERLSGYIKRNKFKEIQLDAAWPNQGDVALLSALVLNSDTPFVSFWPADTDLFKATIGYPSGDIQLEERELLERWFDYVMKRGGSDG